MTLAFFQLRLFLVLVALRIDRACSENEECPDQCVCKWRDGKQTVDCFNASIGVVPPMNVETQVLNLNRNYLPVLEAETFKTLHLVHLQKIYLANCFIREIKEHCFRGLTNLVELDLSFNALTSVPPIDDAKYLMRLSLTGNPLRQILASAFSQLHELNTLELDECGLESIESGAFSGLTHLQYLRLHSNKLQNFRPATNFPPNIRVLTLHNNLWLCDCELVNLHKWLLNFSVPYSVEPRCAAPDRVIDREIRSMNLTEFACIPEVHPESTYREVIEGKNVTLDCTVKAIPQASIFWYYKETLIQNGSTLIDDIDMRQYYHSETKVETDKSSVKSTLFLASASVDDNGTFLCVAKNNAGRAQAKFSLHVVVPMPPKPPQDVVEDRFRTEYLIVIVVAVSLLLLVISSITIGLLALRCKRGRDKDRKNFIVVDESSLQKSCMPNTSIASDFGSNDTLSTQMTVTPAAAIPPSTVATKVTSTVSYTSLTIQESDLSLPTTQPDILSEIEMDIESSSSVAKENGHMNNNDDDDDVCFRQRLQTRNRLSPPTPFADETQSFSQTKLLKRQCQTLPRNLSKCDKILVLPPPPQYKGVHFDPGIESNEKSFIPTEGLPDRPAKHGEMIKIKPLPPQRQGSVLSGNHFHGRMQLEEKQK